MNHLIHFLAFLAVTGCATFNAPHPPTDHPANPDAPESAFVPVVKALETAHFVATGDGDAFVASVRGIDHVGAIHDEDDAYDRVPGEDHYDGGVPGGNHYGAVSGGDGVAPPYRAPAGGRGAAYDPQANRPAVPNAEALPLEVSLEAYLAIGDRLAANSTDGVRELALDLEEAVAELLSEPLPGDEHFWHMHEPVAAGLSEVAAELAQTVGLGAARRSYAAFSAAFSRVLEAADLPSHLDGDVQLYACSMFDGAEGVPVWLQLGNGVRNPYMGTAMLMCYTSHETIGDRSSADPELRDAPGEASAHDHDTEGGR